MLRSCEDYGFKRFRYRIMIFLFNYNGALGDVGSLQKMHTCPAGFMKKNDHMPKVISQNKHVAKERGNTCGKVEDSKCKRWAWLGKLAGGGRHRAKEVT